MIHVLAGGNGGKAHRFDRVVADRNALGVLGVLGVQCCDAGVLFPNLRLYASLVGEPGGGLLEEFFGKVNGGGDIKALAAEYDTKIDALING